MDPTFLILQSKNKSHEPAAPAVRFCRGGDTLIRFRFRAAVAGGLCCVFLALGAAVAGAAPSRILVLPFTIHAEKDLSFLNNGIQSMLAARLNRQGAVEVVRHDRPAADEAAAAKIGATQGAAYVLTGTLTLFGNSVSTDATLIDVKTGQIPVRFNETGADSGDVIRHVDLLARQINQDVFGIVPKAEAPRAAPAAVPAPQAVAPAAGAVPVPVAAAAPAAAAATTAAAAPALWKSNLLSMAVCGLSAGDVDGNGSPEIAAIDAETVYVYRRTGENLNQLSIFKANRGDRLIAVDAADINGNGKAEIYVTAMAQGGQLASFVLEWDGSRLRNMARDLNWYFRVIDGQKGAGVLIGQQGVSTRTESIVAELEDQNRLFRGDVVELTWRGDRLTPGGKIALPDGMNVFGFTRAEALNDGRQVIAGFNDQNDLIVVGDTGKREFKSSESYGGSLNYLEYKSGSQFSAADRYYLPLRVHVTDLDGDGTREIVTAKNQDYTRNLLTRYRQFASGQVVCLGWDKIAMKEKWATEKVADFVADTALADFDGDGRPEVVFAVSTSGGILEKAQSYIVTYRP